MRIAAFLSTPELRAQLADVSTTQGWQLLCLESTSEIAAIFCGSNPPEVLVSDELPALLLTGATHCQRLLIGTAQELPVGVQCVSADDRQALIASLTQCASVARLRDQFGRLERQDPITRLPRHTELLERAMAYRGASVGLIALQLDHADHLYKDLDPISKTDLLGHISDFVQAQLATNAELGFVDAACFAVLLPASTEDEARDYATLLVEAFRPGIAYRGSTLHLTASAGYALESRCEDPERLWRSAWLAKQIAERAGGDQAQGAPRPNIGQRIPSALVRDEFSLVLQGQWSTATQNLTGVEALLRWQGMEVGELAPNHFIPIAEATGQMARIGDWVIERACHEAATWFEHLVQPIVLSINVSPQQFEKGVITQQIKRLTDTLWLDPNMLELELNHEQMLYIVDHHRAAVYELRDMGVRFALDGLGSGLIEAEKLLRCPADTLKLDRSLVAQIDESSMAQSLAHEICQLAERFNLRTVGVGVETEQQMQLLAQAGCTDLQGYLLSKPVPLPDFRAFLNRRYASLER